MTRASNGGSAGQRVCTTVRGGSEGRTRVGVARMLLGAWMATCALVPAAALAQASPAGAANGEGRAAPGIGFATAPEALRVYFQKAARADAIEDPLQRCLSFPDFPGVKWPSGYAEAHCHYHHDEPLPLSEIADLLAAGRLDELEKQARDVLARHSVPGPEQEGTHRLFTQFEALQADAPVGEPTLSIASRWAVAAPRSAIAATAHGNALAAIGWKARGSDYASETAREQMAAMSRQFDLAERELRRAIALDPTMLDAYISLVDIGRGDRSEVGQWAFEQAAALDPGCADLAYRRMTALTPRWGGSLKEMEAYAVLLHSHVGRRPLLANQLAEPAVQLAWVLRDNADAKPHVLVALEDALRFSGNEAGMNAIARALLASEDDAVGPRAIALLLQSSRFKAINAWEGQRVGQYLAAREPSWAVRVIQRALAINPKSPQVNFTLGLAYHMQGTPDLARVHYLEAAKSPDHSEDAFQHLIAMQLYVPNDNPIPLFEAARTDIEQFHRAHPDSPSAMYFMTYLRGLVGPARQWDVALMKRFLATTEREWPEERRQVANIERLLAAATSQSKAPVAIDY